MEVNPTQKQLEAGLGNWLKNKREHDRLIEATAFTKCVEYSIFSHKAHREMSEEQLFKFIYERFYEKIISTAPEKYSGTDEIPTPEMMRLFDRFKKWQEENGKERQWAQFSRMD